MENQHRRIAGYRELDEPASQIIAEQKAIETVAAPTSSVGQIDPEPAP